MLKDLRTVNDICVEHDICVECLHPEGDLPNITGIFIPPQLSATTSQSRRHSLSGSGVL